MTSGTPASAARQTTPIPATWPSPTASSQPVAGGSAASHDSALATRAAEDRTATFGRPVVPEVRIATAGAVGSASNDSAPGASPSTRASSPSSRTAKIEPESAKPSPTTATRARRTVAAAASSDEVSRVPTGAATAPTRAIA